MIKIILTQDVPGQGKKGAVLNVSDGFARNYLIPGNKAVLATDEAIRKLETEEKNKTNQEKKLSDLNESLKNQLEKLRLEIKKEAEGKKLFGSVTVKDVLKVLADAGFNFSPKNVEIEKPIKSLGEHVVEIVLNKNHRAKIKIAVVSE